METFGNTSSEAVRTELQRAFHSFHKAMESYIIKSMSFEHAPALSKKIEEERMLRIDYRKLSIMELHKMRQVIDLKLGKVKRRKAGLIPKLIQEKKAIVLEIIQMHDKEPKIPIREHLHNSKYGNIDDRTFRRYKRQLEELGEIKYK